MAAEREVVGRRAELDQLGDFLRRPPGGLAACVLTGPAGMGKTTVWRHGVELAREEGFAVLSTRPGEAEARLSYAGLFDLLAAVEAERLDGLPPVQRRALEVVILQRDADGGPVAARAVATAVLSLLTELATSAPLLLAVDDAHWLDRATASALSYALRRLEGAPVGVLAAVRSDGTRHRTFLDSISAERRTEIALGPLSLAAVHAIVRSELGHTLPRPTLVKIVAASGGNPFLALEIARELDRLGEPARAGALPVPADLRTLMRRRLERLPSESRDALLTAACLAVPTTGLVDEEALGPAEEAGIVRLASDGRIEFTHPLLAAAIHDAASTARRRAVHRHLAERVNESEERARHLALGASGPDERVAAELDAAATLARLRGAPEASAQLAELALRLAPPGDAARPRRLLTAAASHFDAGDLTRAQRLLEQALEEATDGAPRAEALRLLGQLHARRSSFVEAIETEIAALEAAAGNDELAAEIELDLAFHCSNVGDFAGGEQHAQAAVAHAAAAEVDGLMANALAVQTVTAFLCGRGVAESDLARALALDDPQREAPLQLGPRFVHGFVLLCTGRLDEALETLDTLRAETLERGRESDVPLLFLYLVWAAIWRGDLRRAAGFAEEARRTADLLDDRVADALALSASALAYAYTGDGDRARRDAAEADEHFERLQWRAGAIWTRWARCFVELALGNPRDAYEAVRPLTEALAVHPTADPALYVFLPDAVEALLQLGRADEAEALLGPFAERALALDRGWALAAAARCRGLLAAARGDLDGALAVLELAVRLYDSLPMPFERARTLLELGRLQRRRRQKRLARLALDEALAVFESCGAAAWVDKAGVELARARPRRSGEGLSTTEESIARLAAEGFTNREIAERAFVSVKTVEANLRRAYGKLGISSRAQLAHALDALSATPPIS